jgi:hypothetical protein
LSTDSNIFLYLFQKLNNLPFMAIKKGMTTNFIFPASFFAVVGSGIQDEKSRPPGTSGICDKHPGSGTLSCVELMQEEEHKWQLAEMRIRLAQHYANQGNWIHVQNPEIGR